MSDVFGETRMGDYSNPSAVAGASASAWRNRQFMQAAITAGINSLASDYVRDLHTEIVAEPVSFSELLRVAFDMRLPDDPNSRRIHGHIQIRLARGQLDSANFELSRDLCQNVADQISEFVAEHLHELLWQSDRG